MGIYIVFIYFLGYVYDFCMPQDSLPSPGALSEKNPWGCWFFVLCCLNAATDTVGGQFPSGITMYNLRSTTCMNYIAYKPRYFYKYASSSISIGVRDRKWC